MVLALAVAVRSASPRRSPQRSPCAAVAPRRSPRRSPGAGCRAPRARQSRPRAARRLAWTCRLSGGASKVFQLRRQCHPHLPRASWERQLLGGATLLLRPAPPCAPLLRPPSQPELCAGPALEGGFHILPAAAAPSAGRRTSAAAPEPPGRAKQAGAHTTSSARVLTLSENQMGKTEDGSITPSIHDKTVSNPMLSRCLRLKKL